MESTKVPIEYTQQRVVFTSYFTLGYCDDVSFSLAGRIFFAADHGFVKGDVIKVTFEKVQDANPDHNNQDR